MVTHYFEVYTPNSLDAHGSFTSAENVRHMAAAFMLRGDKVLDFEHGGEDIKVEVVESFINHDREDFTIGAWVIGALVSDESFVEFMRDGGLLGVSLVGVANFVEREIDVEFDQTIKGTTLPSDGHTHEYIINFDDDGNLQSGMTNTVDGHKHTIDSIENTSTDDGHFHVINIFENISIGD